MQIMLFFFHFMLFIFYFGKKLASALFVYDFGSPKVTTPPPPKLTTPPIGLFMATNNANKHDMVKNLNCQEADQLAIYRHGRGVELGSTEKKTSAKWSERDMNLRPPDFKGGTLTARPCCLQILGYMYMDIFLRFRSEVHCNFNKS